MKTPHKLPMLVTKSSSKPKTQTMFLTNHNMYVEYNYITQKLTICYKDKPMLTLNTKNL
jgi:hypothetical protein